MHDYMACLYFGIYRLIYINYFFIIPKLKIIFYYGFQLTQLIKFLVGILKPQVKNYLSTKKKSLAVHQLSNSHTLFPLNLANLILDYRYLTRAHERSSLFIRHICREENLCADRLAAKGIIQLKRKINTFLIQSSLFCSTVCIGTCWAIDTATTQCSLSWSSVIQ